MEDPRISFSRFGLDVTCYRGTAGAEWGDRVRWVGNDVSGSDVSYRRAATGERRTERRGSGASVIRRRRRRRRRSEVHTAPRSIGGIDVGGYGNPDTDMLDQSACPHVRIPRGLLIYHLPSIDHLSTIYRPPAIASQQPHQPPQCQPHLQSSAHPSSSTPFLI
jgi:hypothetical protein